METEGTLFSYVRNTVGPGPLLNLQIVLKNLRYFHCQAEHMFSTWLCWSTSVPPPSPLPLVSSLHSTPNINWVRGTIPPSVRDRSPSVSHSSTVKSPADLHTCVHTHRHVGGGASLNYRDIKLTSVNNQSKRKELQTASPANPALSFDQTHMNRQVKFIANGGNTHASRATVWHQHKTITIMVRQQKLYIQHTYRICCLQPELLYTACRLWKTAFNWPVNVHSHFFGSFLIYCTTSSNASLSKSSPIAKNLIIVWCWGLCCTYVLLVITNTYCSVGEMSWFHTTTHRAEDWSLVHRNTSVHPEKLLWSPRSYSVWREKHKRKLVWPQNYWTGSLQLN